MNDMILFIQVQSLSDQEEENDPDGIYAFRRKKGCNYHAVSSRQYWLIYLPCISCPVHDLWMQVAK